MKGRSAVRINDKGKNTFRTSLDGLALGDHICSQAADLPRHGIYAGGCQVVCCADGVIARMSLDAFAGGRPISIQLDKAEYTASEIVRRADSQLQPHTEADFLSGEHFCKWCRRGLLPVE